MDSPGIWPASGSMKKEVSQLVKIEDFYRRCLQAKKPRLGQVAAKRAGRIMETSPHRQRETLWDRIRDR